jgi:hypothetical protein
VSSAIGAVYAASALYGYVQMNRCFDRHSASPPATTTTAPHPTASSEPWLPSVGPSSWARSLLHAAESEYPPGLRAHDGAP